MKRPPADCGARAVFVGIVRLRSGGRRVRFLEYTAHAGLARRQLRLLENQARRRWGLREVTIFHRIGRLKVGDPSVWISASAPHRRAALEACRWLIERTKKEVPIWKKEEFRRGRPRWVGWGSTA